MQTCFAIPTPSFSYTMNGITLDAPYLATGQTLSGGNVMAGASFALIWKSASSPTTTAMANGAVGTMVFANADGSKMSAKVKVNSATSGSLLIATCTVLSITPVDTRVIVTQFA